MPSDKPTQDEMRYAIAQPIPQSEFERGVGTLGGYIDKAGKFISEATQPIAKSHPVRAWLAENLVAAPLRNAGSAMQDWTNTPREITEEQPYTPGPFYGGSKATLNPNTWGPALQSFKTDPRVLDVASMAPLATTVARKAGAPVARAAGEALTNRMLAGESMIPGLSQSVAPSPLMFAVKPKGGNWIGESVKQNIDTLKSFNEHVNPQLNRELGLLDEATRVEKVNQPIDRWIDKKMVPYIRNEMGTKEDPVRQLAERGVLHVPENHNLMLEDAATTQRRIKAGHPMEGYGQSRLAQQWEAMSDSAVGTKTAKEWQSMPYFMETDPWLKDVDPKVAVHAINSNKFSRLGFEHILDELSNALDPASTLPKNLRLTPEQLEKVTMPQAVERVAKINAWRNEQASKAEREGMMQNLTAAPRLEVPEAKLSFVDKPGMKWVDIPETTEKNGMQLCTTIGKQGGWCTQGEHLAKSYGSGDNRLTALLDAEGRPHAQAKISKSKVDASQTELGDYLTEDEAVGDQFYRNIDTVLRNRGIDEDTISDVIDHVAAGGPRNRIPEHVQDMLPEVEAEAERMLPVRQLEKPDITELKPVGNDFNSTRAAEYQSRDPNYRQVVQQGVLDFLNKGDWGKVNDLDHYDIFDLHDPKSVQNGLQDILGDYHLSHERASIFNAAVTENPEANRFMNRSQLRQFLEPYSIEPNTKPEGYKDGGGVHAVDSDSSAQFYSRTMDNPDQSKTTETGIAKQFEEDYMRFALQRTEQPKRQELGNTPAPAAQTNIYGEYGTPVAGGVVSGRVTKMGNMPDTYMGSLNYRTQVGPGMATVGVQGMRTPQMPAHVTGYQAGYGVPLGDNGFAGVNVVRPAEGGKPIFGAQLQYRKQFAKGGAVTIDEMRHELMRNK